MSPAQLETLRSVGPAVLFLLLAALVLPLVQPRARANERGLGHACPA